METQIPSDFSDTVFQGLGRLEFRRKIGCELLFHYQPGNMSAGAEPA